jgi:hypothetical protein
VKRPTLFAGLLEMNRFEFDKWIGGELRRSANGNFGNPLLRHPKGLNALHIFAKVEQSGVGYAQLSPAAINEDFAASKVARREIGDVSNFAGSHCYSDISLREYILA